MKKIFTLVLIVVLNYSHAQVDGCTDALATNYNSSATQNDGSCIYGAETIVPESSSVLPDTMLETSGLIQWNNKIWTHNDSNDNKLYSFDASDPNTFETTTLTSTINTDWEDISQDADYIYVGDFGNNANENRTDLHILRITKSSISAGPLVIDTINFSYSLQTDFTPTGSNSTNFDCEAFIVSSDSIYLFTKEWVSKQSSIYSLPKQPGTHVASFRGVNDVEGLITGATYMEEKNLIALSGYVVSITSQPFIYLLYDFKADDFWSGNKRKIALNLNFHQVEGITTVNGSTYYISNEKFSTTVEPQLHQIDLSTYLTDYLDSPALDIVETARKALSIFPNPASSYFLMGLNDEFIGEQYNIADMNGNIVLQGKLNSSMELINIDALAQGTYLVTIDGQEFSTKIVKK